MLKYYLILNSSPLGDAGLTALLPALCGLPKLVYLDLICTDMGDEGLASLVAQPTARALKSLKELALSGTNIGDEGVASLVAQPTAGALKSLEVLYLFDNEITDAGCATLASALRGGALPALTRLELNGNPEAGQQARNYVRAALSARQ